MTQDRRNPLFRSGMIAVFLLAALALAAGGYMIYAQQLKAIRTSRLDDLKAIASLKCDQLEDWREERAADARIYSTGIVRTNLLQWLETRQDAALKEAIRGRLDVYAITEGYQNICIALPNGELLLTLDHALKKLAPDTQRLVEKVATTGTVLEGDFYLADQAPLTLLDFAVPVKDDTEKTVAVMILSTDPARSLFPLIRRWPLPSASAETLIVRRDGDSVLFLNPLRHRADAAMRLRIPLTRTDVPAVQAVLGHTGSYDGSDYRGMPVLADLRAVPGTPWFMVTKVDADELLAEMHYRASMILALVALAILVAGGMVLLVANNRSRNLYRALFLSERERHATQEEIRATLYSIGDGVIATDEQCRVTRMNPIAETLTGWPEAEALGRPLSEVFHIISEVTHIRVTNPAETVLRTGKIVGLANHTLLLSRDGSARPIADSGAPILLEQGVISGVVLVFRDQTAERATEAALRASEEKYRLLIENQSDLAVKVDLNGRFLFVSPSYCRMFGKTEEELLGHSFMPLVHEDDRESTARAIESLFHPPHQVYHEQRAMTANGWRWLAWADTVMLDEAGHVKEIIGIGRDITERKQAEEALLRERMLTNAILDSTPGIIYLYDDQQRLVRWNKRHEELTGYSAEELQGKSNDDWYVGDEVSQAAVAAGIRNALEHGFGEAEANLQLKNGEKRPMYFTACPLVIEGRTYFVGIGIDITERRRAEEDHRRLQEQLAQAQKMESVGCLAGGVAHDFNNMLGVILGHTEVALAQINPSAQLYQDLLAIRQAAQRSADLTRQLLAFARKQPVSPRVLDLNETVGGTLKMLQRLIGEDIELIWKPAPMLWPVVLDPSQMDQILANLAVNARDAITGVGNLTIATENQTLDASYCSLHTGFVPGDYVLLEVSDTGCGMEKAVQEHLFEPFFTTKEVGKGTGLGLATVYGAIKQNGGFINVYSEPGSGTCFKIFLPRAAGAISESKADSAIRPRQPAAGTETVLLAEDEEMIRNLIKTVLSQLGYTVLAARTPQEALTLAEEHAGKIDLLITDVVMPGMNGKELKDLLVALRPGLKALFMSGYTADVIARQGMLDEGVEFLQKPFSVNTLTQKIREMMNC
jgi:PAS domain S-box-containing protein